MVYSADHRAAICPSEFVSGAELSCVGKSLPRASPGGICAGICTRCHSGKNCGIC